jgi:hypothetical protein
MEQAKERLKKEVVCRYNVSQLKLEAADAKNT